jgi:hypothetical protein
VTLGSTPEGIGMPMFWHACGPVLQSIRTFWSVLVQG